MNLRNVIIVVVVILAAIAAFYFIQRRASKDTKKIANKQARIPVHKAAKPVAPKPAEKPAKK